MSAFDERRGSSIARNGISGFCGGEGNLGGITGVIQTGTGDGTSGNSGDEGVARTVRVAQGLADRGRRLGIAGGVNTKTVGGFGGGMNGGGINA